MGATVGVGPVGPGASCGFCHATGVAGAARSRSASDGSVAMLSEESTEEETAGSRQSTRSRLKSLRQSMAPGRSLDS